jgi:hypothetical protein
MNMIIGALITRSALRTGLISGSSKVIHPILAWLLPRVQELQTRAYLAKFLVKIEIPQDIRADIETEELYQQVFEDILHWAIQGERLNSYLKTSVMLYSMKG